MTLFYASNVRDAIVETFTGFIDAGSGPGKIRIYSGTRPPDGDTGIGAQVLLVEIAFVDPAGAPISLGGVVDVAGVPLTGTAVADGTASFFRILDSDDNPVADGDIFVGGGELALTTTTITTGDPIKITGGFLGVLS